MEGDDSAERETVSRRIRVKSPAWNSVEVSPKCFMNREAATLETVSETPMSWFPGREAMYGELVVSLNTFRNRRYSLSQLTLLYKDRTLHFVIPFTPSIHEIAEEYCHFWA